jgi:hypothetical protein
VPVKRCSCLGYMYTMTVADGCSMQLVHVKHTRASHVNTVTTFASAEGYPSCSRSRRKMRRHPAYEASTRSSQRVRPCKDTVPAPFPSFISPYIPPVVSTQPHLGPKNCHRGADGTIRPLRASWCKPASLGVITFLPLSGEGPIKRNHTR